ncbi:hypothetical protein TUMSATVNIG1_42530 [Vibrio nigripulchritudo]|uniref:DUF6884 domain-containing protein n=1 Tax=Vibrio nigripulchritudo TaxID=28173 RepID=UPI00190BE25A|nr:DUF6884 domain-containing protein [Vibrio nigripulchritudo]BCL72285.1 hypothetical protein VNTUMSATTG_42220 [Vibrio nigripulchritudo]BDU33644.1 hypothetical protein TUMSATVNIG1_42530 [Vibrio nigripulchritudo]
MKNVVLISCVKSKNSNKSIASELYTSPLFKYNMAYAKKIGADNVYILSALYGVLKLDEEIEPYEKTLNNMHKPERLRWSMKVLSQLKELEALDNTKFTILAGVKYREYILPYLKEYSIPFEGLALGEQLKKLKELTS